MAVKKTRVQAAAVPAEELAGTFPKIALPIQPPYPPMEARSASRLPTGADWLYEPKWDGFRCLAFRKGRTVALQSKHGQPLDRYFPELAAAFRALPFKTFVLDGEIVIRGGSGLDFDALLQRIHPAASRIAKLSRETPASFQAFDLLVDEKGKSIVDLSLRKRRERLDGMLAALPEEASVELSPATPDRKTAERWMRDLGGGGLDGVVAKRADSPYLSGDRSAMVKVKRMRTADCVVGGFRWAQKGGQVGSLLLGLYDKKGLLDHVGFSSSFTAEERRELEPILVPLIEPPGFTGKAPGGPSRWSQGRSTEWESLRPVLVCEVRYDHVSGGRFRHGTKFLRWRPDKESRACTFDQLRLRSASLPGDA
jgi:ATP-dependent DNA ligase